MKPLRLFALFILLACIGATAHAQTPARVRGTITGIDANVLSVKSREGKDLRIELAPNATFAYMENLNIADVRPGTALGTSALAGPDGKIVAIELHLFPAGRPVPNEGHRPWDLEPNSTMTNGTVTAMVEAGNGGELTLSYKDGTQKVVVPAIVNWPLIWRAEDDAGNARRAPLVQGPASAFLPRGSHPPVRVTTRLGTLLPGCL